MLLAVVLLTGGLVGPAWGAGGVAPGAAAPAQQLSTARVVHQAPPPQRALLAALQARAPPPATPSALDAVQAVLQGTAKVAEAVTNSTRAALAPSLPAAAPPSNLRVPYRYALTPNADVSDDAEDPAHADDSHDGKSDSSDDSQSKDGHSKDGGSSDSHDSGGDHGSSAAPAAAPTGIPLSPGNMRQLPAPLGGVAVKVSVNADAASAAVNVTAPSTDGLPAGAEPAPTAPDETTLAAAAAAAAAPADAIAGAPPGMTPAEAFAAKRAQHAGGAVSGWVVCSWRLANVKDPRSVAKRRPGPTMSAYIANATSLDPGQVNVLATANVSMGLRFAGVDLAADPAATATALRAAFAELALGFDPTYIYVSPQPDASADAVKPTVASAAVGSRRLLRQADPAFERLLLRGALRARLLRAAEAAIASAPAGSWKDTAYASYTQLLPSSVNMLINALTANCGSLQEGAQLPANCTALFAHFLSLASVPVTPDGFSVTLVRGDAVTMNVLAAVGFSQQQVDAGAHEQLVSWLQDTKHVQAMLNAGGIDVAAGAAVAGWLQAPQIIYSELRSARRANVALAIGLAVPLSVCLAALVALLAVAAVRRRRRLQGAGGAGGGLRAGGGGAAEAAKKKKRQKGPAAAGKRRYMAPPSLPGGPSAANQSIEELAAANLRAAGGEASGSGGGGGRASISSSNGTAGGPGPGYQRLTQEAVAAVAAASGPRAGAEEEGGGLEDSSGSESGSRGGDLRPRLRSLGDSVTSAARFEAEAGEEETSDEPSSAAAAAAAALATEPAGGADGAAEDAIAPLESRRGSGGGGGNANLGSASRSRSSGSGAALPAWPGPVEEAAPEAQSGPSVIMGAANPPRVGSLASPFGAYNFSAIGAPAGVSGTAAAAAAPRGAASGSVGPDGIWVAPSLEASLALASGGGSGAASSDGPGSRGGGGGGGAAAATDTPTRCSRLRDAS